MVKTNSRLEINLKTIKTFSDGDPTHISLINLDFSFLSFGRWTEVMGLSQ